MTSFQSNAFQQSAFQSKSVALPSFQSNAFQFNAFQAEKIVIPAFQGGAFQFNAFQTTKADVEEDWTPPLWISTQIKYKHKKHRQHEDELIIMLTISGL